MASPTRDDTRIAHMVSDWCAPAGPEIILSRGLFKFAVVDETRIPQLTVDTLDKENPSRVVRYSKAAEHARIAALSSAQETVMRSIGGTETWRQRTDTLRQAITTCPDVTDLAVVRMSAGIPLCWRDIHSLQPFPEPNEVDGNHLRHLPHLLGAYTPDAHGIQVLRDAHLDNANDLTGWTITGLGHGRHLVEAPDLAPWYSDVRPDPHVLAQARGDFGPMIITKEIIANNPPPWSPNGALPWGPEPQPPSPTTPIE